ncbi:ABC transporter permease [Catellatospora vulcania]|uniref:ABC transporter permease n=1 Tax=Catellatospora vulcania TaxID=1460450 RepID=UPI0012D45983|nr:ABC transporter permease [Catellatospora vulcania]
MTMLYYIGRRVAAALLTLIAVSAVLLAASEVLPGDAASASLGITSTPEEVQALRDQLGLDRPLPVRYVEWMGGALRGDLGVSIMARRPVTEVVSAPLADTTLLVFLAAAVTVPLSVLIGVLGAVRRGRRLDRALTAGAVVTVSVPQFVMASLLVLVFSSTLHLLPAVSLAPVGGGPLDRPEILVLPVLALAGFATAWASRLVRAAVIDANAAPNVEAARLAGLPERVVVWRHVLPATVGPCVQAFAWLISGLFGGTAVVEQVFNYRGLSYVLVDAVRNHDTAVLEGVGLLLATIILVAFIIADVLALLANPKLRTATA